MSTTWTLTYDQRPWSLNEERKHHWSWRNERVEEWRDAFYWLAKKAHVPHCQTVTFLTRTYMTGVLADPVNQYPAIKAAIDGVVLAGVIPDDTGEHVRLISFVPPVRSRDQRVELEITRLT